jgi:hypothetical protein
MGAESYFRQAEQCRTSVLVTPPRQKVAGPNPVDANTLVVHQCRQIREGSSTYVYRENGLFMRVCERR